MFQSAFAFFLATLGESINPGPTLAALVAAKARDRSEAWGIVLGVTLANLAWVVIVIGIGLKALTLIKQLQLVPLLIAVGAGILIFVATRGLIATAISSVEYFVIAIVGTFFSVVSALDPKSIDLDVYKRSALGVCALVAAVAAATLSYTRARGELLDEQKLVEEKSNKENTKKEKTEEEKAEEARKAAEEARKAAEEAQNASEVGKALLKRLKRLNHPAFLYASLILGLALLYVFLYWTGFSVQDGP